MSVVWVAGLVGLELLMVWFGGGRAGAGLSKVGGVGVVVGCWLLGIIGLYWRWNWYFGGLYVVRFGLISQLLFLEIFLKIYCYFFCFFV